MESEEGKFNILVGCSGSVAAIKVPSLLDSLRKLNISGHKVDIKVIATKHTGEFIRLDELCNECILYTDDDEWSGWNSLGDPVLHIELRKWADIFVIAPLSANTMAKIANGLCDNLVTCVARAWDREKPFLFCPAMNTHMWEHPITSKHMSELKNLGYVEVPCISKKLACGEVGYGAMAEVKTIVDQVSETLLDIKQDS